jgi:hypothetical protein
MAMAVAFGAPMHAWLHDRRWRPVAWLGLGLLVLLVDYGTGRELQFPLLYVVPVALGAWFGERTLAMILAVTLPMCRIWFDQLWRVPETAVFEGVNATIQAVMLLAFAWLIARVARRERALEVEVQTLRGLLPICSFCKKIRDDRGDWEPLERYISDRSDAQFSHGLCPDCVRKHYSEFMD